MTFHDIHRTPCAPVPPAAHQPGPVTLAIRALRPNAILSRDVLEAQHEDERRALRELRERIASRIEADLAMLDALDGDPDFEVLHEDDEDTHDLEAVDEDGDTSDDEPNDSGICDVDGLYEQVGAFSIRWEIGA